MVQKKIKVILSEKSGVSILFVLAVMLLLMAIGISTLVAASTAVGSGNNAWEERQMEAYSDSVIKTFTANLQSTVEADFGQAFTVHLIDEAEKVEVGTDVTKPYIKEIYAVDGTKDVAVSFKNLSSKVNNKTDKLVLTFTDGISANVSPKVELGVGDNKVELLQMIIINGFNMTVTHETTLNKGNAKREKVIKKQVKYRYSGATYSGAMVSGKKTIEHGKWEVVGYGKIS